MSNWLLLNEVSQFGNEHWGPVLIRVDAIAYVRRAHVDNPNARTVIGMIGNDDYCIYVRERMGELDAALLTEMKIPKEGR